jgi:hypothetical protein
MPTRYVDYTVGFSWGVLRLSPLGHYLAHCTSPGWGMMMSVEQSMGNWSTWRKPGPKPLCPPQTPHHFTWARTWAAAVGSRRLATWATTRLPEYVSVGRNMKPCCVLRCPQVTLHNKIKKRNLLELCPCVSPDRSRYRTASLNLHGELVGDRKWNGIVGMLADRQVNISCSDLTMTTPRLEVVDFIEPMWTSRYSL